MLIPQAIVQQGGVWTPYTPAWTSDGTQPVLNNGTITGRYFLLGTYVHGKVELTMGSTTTFGTGNYSFSLPVTAAATMNVGFGSVIARGFDASPGTGILVSGYIGSTTTWQLVATMYDTTTSPISLVTNTVPVTWAQNDIIRSEFIYEAA